VAVKCWARKAATAPHCCGTVMTACTCQSEPGLAHVCHFRAALDHRSLQS
jgi:hypothetical protein